MSKSIYKIWKYVIIKIGNGEPQTWFASLLWRTHLTAKFTDVFFVGNKSQQKLPKKQQKIKCINNWQKSKKIIKYNTVKSVW